MLFDEQQSCKATAARHTLCDAPHQPGQQSPDQYAAVIAAMAIMATAPESSSAVCALAAANQTVPCRCSLLQVTPLADANKAEPSASVVRSVEFHPNGQLLLTAGLDKRLRLFQVRAVASEPP